MSEANGKTSTGIQPNLEGLLCYVGWWVTGIIFLILEKENPFVRFHAVQSIIVFVVLSIALIIVPWIPVIGGILSWLIYVLSFILWVVLMFQAYQGKKFKLPLAGDMAENQSKPAAK